MPHRAFLVPVAHGSPRTYGSVEAVLAHALGHARNRLLHACEAISWVGGLALGGPTRPTPVFSLAGATVQDGTAGGDEQAAHVLPGQLLIDGRPPWVLAGGESAKIAWLARFMVTAAVPAPFNRADSAAEGAGLKEAFRGGCARAWTCVAGGGRDLTATYELFLADADRAFQRADTAKEAKQTAAAARGRGAARDERLVERLILRAYRAHGVTAKEANRLFPLVARAT